MIRLLTASFVTLSLMIGMVISVVLAVMTATGTVSLPVAIAMTVVFNLLLWYVSPWFTDLSLRWFNGMVFVEDAELAQRYPHVHRLIHEVADEYRFGAPRVGLIKDRNPTAFTYGRGRGNARIVVTEGIFEFLDEGETRAVVAHELGHIVHRDFILMTVAGCLVQILYQVYMATTTPAESDSKQGESDSKKKLAWIGLIALVFYHIGEYLLLYLSRAREYLADSFAARRTDPRHLANALVKIAYGIAAANDTAATDRLLKSTRHMGLIDVKNARAIGLLAGTSGSGEKGPDAPEDGKPVAIPAEAMLFDCYNPWAMFIEINSTHPLTGKRILALGTMAAERQRPFDMDIPAAARKAGLGKGALWGHFLSEAWIYYAPYFVVVGMVLAGYWPLALAAAAAAVLLTLLRRYPSIEEPQPTTVGALMADPRMSPVFGKPVRLEGTAIGRVDPGFFAGEDVMFRDRTGFTAVDFRSMAGFVGDFFAGWLRVKKHIGQPGQVTGWFRRSLSGYVILRDLTTPAGRLGAVPYFWQAFLCLAAIAITAVFIVGLGPQNLYQPIPWSEIGKAFDQPKPATPPAATPK